MGWLDEVSVLVEEQPPQSPNWLDDVSEVIEEQPAARFDPEGSGYDYETARSEGLSADETGHWPSRAPSSGMLLKGRTHKTWDLLEEGEREAGYEISRGKDGRYYSQPPPAARVPWPTRRGPGTPACMERSCCG